jgi:biotin transport system substrate-specific component
VSTPSNAIPRSKRRWLVAPDGPGAVLADALPGDRLRDLLLVVGYAGFVGLAAQVVIPLWFTPVPVTGQTFAVMLGAAALGWGRALSGMLVYALAGLGGVPWFADASGGLDMFAAPSFGYILGFVVASLLGGGGAARAHDRHPLKAALVLALGGLVVYAFGLPWLMATLGVGLAKGLQYGVTPFLLGDLLKLVVAAGLLSGAWALLRRRSG